MKHKDSIYEENLDDLLKAYSLNEFSEEKDIAMAQLVFSKDYDVDLNIKKEKELLDKLRNFNRGSGHRNFFWIALFLVTLTIIATLFVYYNKEEKGINEIDQKQETLSEDNNPEYSELEPVLLINDSSIEHYYIKNEPIDVVPDVSDTTVIAEPSEPDAPKIIKNTPIVQSLFTKKEMKYYQDLKIEMISKIISVDEKIYTYVDEGRIVYKGKKRGVDAFIIRNFSITNMEYKAFLSDLIRRGNKDVLKLTTVNNQGWRDYNCIQLKSEYFKGDKYDGFPVVNISPEAVLLFCKWLEKETNSYLKLKNPKAKPFKIRLPFDYEWINSCKIGVARTTKCDGYQTIYDKGEGLVGDAFLKRIKKIQLKDEKKKSKADSYVEINRYGLNENEMLTIFENAHSDDPLIYPIGLADISKVAHVSEFIQNDTQNIIVFGDCWKSKKQYSTMLSEFKKRDASPFIGFRFIIEKSNMETYKNPFW